MKTKDKRGDARSILDWQLNIIKDANVSHRDAARMTGKSYSSVKYHRSKLGIKVNEDAKAIDYWDEAEIKILKENKNKTNKEVAELLNRSEKSVQLKRSRRKLLGPNNNWSEDEKSFLIKSYGILSAKKIAAQLGRTTNAIIDFAFSLGLSKKNTFWAKPEVKVLQENIDKTPTDLLMLLPGKTLEQISYKKSYLNYINKQKVPEAETDIDNDVRLSAYSMTLRYVELLNTLEVGQSLEYPAKDKVKVYTATKELAHKHFATKAVSDITRRIWRIG